MSNETKYTGPGFCTLLGILFIGLRLTGFIDWPWWVVLMPIWVPIALLVLLLLVLVILDRP